MRLSAMLSKNDCGSIPRSGRVFLPLSALFVVSSLVGAQSLADRLKGIQSGQEGQAPALTLPDWKPVSSSTSSVAIPVVPGLIVSGAQAGIDGDKEQIRRVSDASGKDITVIVEWDKPGVNGQRPQQQSSTRVIDLADLANSHRLMYWFHINQKEHYPGSTAFTASAEIINQLRAGQPSPFFMQTVSDPLTNLLTMQTGKMHTVPWNGNELFDCTLERAAKTDVAIPMIVNSVKLELPAIHATCSQNGTEPWHLYFLDQPANPIILASLRGDDRTQMIKIDFPVAATRLENALAEKKPVEIYGIYFDFNSATIKPDSDAVLKQISDIMHKNPDWKLSVSGHTDNIGDSAANDLLSKRRSAAVKDALVSRYGIAPGRLTTAGFGAGHPIEPNNTLEGRARNRRVELQRQ